MSYYATADGNIRLKNRLSEEQFEELLDVLLEVFEEYDTEDDYQQVFFGGHIKYDDDIVLETLSNIINNFEIEEGEVDYVGEDSALCVTSSLTVSGRNRTVRATCSQSADLPIKRPTEHRRQLKAAQPRSRIPHF